MHKSLPVSVACLALALSTPARALAEGKTPEDTVRSFLGSAKALDLDGMIRSFAVETYVDGYDLRGVALEIGTLILRDLPKEYPAYRRANGYARQAVAARMSVLFLIAVSGAHQRFDRSILIQDAAQLDALLRDLNPERARGLQVLQIREAAPPQFRDAIRVEFDKQAKPFGASRCVERVALIRIGEDTYAVPFRLLRYPAGWQIESMESMVSNLIGASPMSEKDYLEKFPD